MKIDSVQLRNIRKNLGYSQHVMASKLSITRELVNKMETGKNTVSPRTYFRLQELFGDQLTQLMLPPIHDIRDPYNHYINPQLRPGWQGVPIYNQPLNGAFTAAWLEHRLPAPDTYYADTAYADCDFAAQFKGESLLDEVRNGDRVFCQHVKDLGFLEFGVIYFIVTTNGQEVCKFLYPHTGDDPELFLLLSTQKEVPATPLKKSYIARIFRVKGIIRNY